MKLIRLLPQTVYRRVCAAATVAERTTLLRSTALEGMRLYGTDISHRMYLVESPIDRPDQVAFCVAIPPESRGGVRGDPAGSAGPQSLPPRCV